MNQGVLEPERYLYQRAHDVYTLLIISNQTLALPVPYISSPSMLYSNLPCFIQTSMLFSPKPSQALLIPCFLRKYLSDIHACLKTWLLKCNDEKVRISSLTFPYKYGIILLDKGIVLLGEGSKAPFTCMWGKYRHDMATEKRNHTPILKLT